MIWTSSDYHVGHVNVLKYCKRPFANVDDMNEKLIAAHNACVNPEDTFYFLGDFAMGQRKLTLPLGKRLNGYKILIGGNHDSAIEIMKDVAGFHEVHSSLIIEHAGKKLLLRHEPMPNFKEIYPEVDIQLCGHVHELWKVKDNMINVGVDVWDYKPRTLDEILSMMK